MSPYRVLVMDQKGTLGILSSMHSVNKKTKETKIFILEKTSLNSTGFDVSEVAHMISTKKNSTILASYRMEKNEDGRTYKLYCVSGLSTPSDDRLVSERIYTQQACTEAAMHDFCAFGKLKELQKL